MTAGHRSLPYQPSVTAVMATTKASVNMDFFTEPAAFLPTAGAAIFIALLFMVGCDHSVLPNVSAAHLFWSVIALIAAGICILGNL